MKNQFLPIAALLVLFSCQTNLLTGSKVLALEDANTQKVNSPLQIASTPANKANPDSLRTISKYYQQGDFQTTVAKLKVYLEAKPNDDLAWTILGNSYEKLKDDKNAESAYTKALKINPKRFEALTGMGILQRKRKNYDAAISYYQKSLAINPNYAQAYTSMSVIALKQNKDKQALEYAKKAYELEKNEPVIAANLAIAYHYNGMKDLRDKMTQKAKELGYKNMDVMQKIYSGKMTIRD
jgi:tetratricopeptide (TPR) repeat protein